MAMDKVKYWLDIADYDMGTAEAMLAAGRWLYVGFMCHQVIEKTLKAYWNSKRDDDPPYIHNHKRLAEGGWAIRRNVKRTKGVYQLAYAIKHRSTLSFI